MELNYTNYVFSPYDLSYQAFLWHNSYFSVAYNQLQANQNSQQVKAKVQVQIQAAVVQDFRESCQEKRRKQQKQQSVGKQVDLNQNITSQKWKDFNKNVLPNTIHLILSYIRRKNKSGEAVCRIIRKIASESESYSKKKFYSYQTYLKEKLVNIKYNKMIEGLICYLDPSSTVFTVEEQLFYSKVSRILIYDFLKSGALLNVLSSKKITRTNKDEHLKIQRLLIQKIKSLS